MEKRKVLVRVCAVLSVFVMAVYAITEVAGKDIPTTEPKTWKVGDYEQGGDFTKPHGNKEAGYIRSLVSKPRDFTSLTRGMLADDYRGKRVRMSAYVKSESVKGWAGLWMRLDGPTKKEDCPPECLGFDNMEERPIKGTTNWKKYEVVLDVPEESAKVVYGVLLDGAGQIWVGDLQFEVVGKDVPTTNSL